MLNLIKLDLYRLLKSKGLKIVLIIVLALGILIPLIYAGVAALVVEDTEYKMSEVFTSTGLTMSSVNITGDIGLVLPIFTISFIRKDISQGTIRNKIINGHSRYSIIASLLIASVILMVSIMLIMGLVVFTISSFIFYTAVDKAFMTQFVLTILFDVLIYIFVATLAVFMTVMFKSTVAPIILTVAVIIVLGSVVPGILDIVGSTSKTAESIINVVNFINPMNPSYIVVNATSNNMFSSVYGLIDEKFVYYKYSNMDISFIISTSLIYIALLSTLSLVIFNKVDLK